MLLTSAVEGRRPDGQQERTNEREKQQADRESERDREGLSRKNTTRKQQTRAKRTQEAPRVSGTPARAIFLWYT